MSGVPIRSTLTVLASLVIALQPAATAQVPEGPIRLRASLVEITSTGASAAHVLEITLDKYSSSNEKAELIDTMIKDGQDALRSRMQRIPFKGLMRIPEWTGPDPNAYKAGWGLRYIWREPMADGGTRLVIGTDRPLRLAEVQEDPRTLNFPFTFLEIHLPKAGKGEGRANGATRVVFDKEKKSIELARFATAPIMLNDVTVEAGK
jgi:hypothetical protein